MASPRIKPSRMSKTGSRRYLEALTAPFRPFGFQGSRDSYINRLTDNPWREPAFAHRGAFVALDLEIGQTGPVLAQK